MANRTHRDVLRRFVGLICVVLIGTTALTTTLLAGAIFTEKVFGIPAALADTIAAPLPNEEIPVDSADLPPTAATGTSDAHLVNGAQVFQAHCEGCHINGGNIIRRGKTLKLNALQRNGVDSLDSIAALVTNGKNNMSAFRDRLTEQQIQDVAVYVLEQAKTGWKKS